MFSFSLSLVSVCNLLDSQWFPLTTVSLLVDQFDCFVKCNIVCEPIIKIERELHDSMFFF